VRLPEPGEAYVLAHEGTLAAPKADRLRLMRACQAMTSPILVMHEDGDARLSQAGCSLPSFSSSMKSGTIW